MMKGIYEEQHHETLAVGAMGEIDRVRCCHMGEENKGRKDSRKIQTFDDSKCLLV